MRGNADIRAERIYVRLMRNVLIAAALVAAACTGDDTPTYTAADIHTEVPCGASWAERGWPDVTTCEAPCQEAVERPNQVGGAAAIPGDPMRYTCGGIPYLTAYNFHGTCGCCVLLGDQVRDTVRFAEMQLSCE